MAQSDSDSDDESTISFSDLKNKVHGLNKATLEELLYNLIDTCADIKREVRDLELENEILKNEKLGLHESINVLREDLFLKEGDYTQVEEKLFKVEETVESLLNEKQSLNATIEKLETNLATNNRWNKSSQALDWLNTHHNRNKKGLGYKPKQTVYPIHRKYVGLPENIVCFHCGKTGHYRYTCPLRKHANEKNERYGKQIWIRKDELYMSKRMGPKWIWVPKTNQ